MTTSPVEETLRIGTFNLGDRPRPEHAVFLAAADCDVWLLTEVHESLEVPGYELHLGEGVMAPGRRYAAILSKQPLTSQADPHPASAAATVDGVTVVSSVLPWRTCGTVWPWSGDTQGSKTAAAVDALLPTLRDAVTIIWGGDWNHALSGPQYAGSVVGNAAINQVLDDLRMTAPTADLPHPLGGCSIDHIALGPGLTSVVATRLDATSTKLSDHDAYVVEAVLRR